VGLHLIGPDPYFKREVFGSGMAAYSCDPSYVGSTDRRITVQGVPGVVVHSCGPSYSGGGR
jgi:hypothetical protein